MHVSQGIGVVILAHPSTKLLTEWLFNSMLNTWPAQRGNASLLIDADPDSGRLLTKVIIEKCRGEQFLWNRNWYLGWIWAGWHYWKKQHLGWLWATFEAVFFKFLWAIKINKKHCSLGTKKLHKMKLKRIFFFQKMKEKPTFFSIFL